MCAEMKLLLVNLKSLLHENKVSRSSWELLRVPKMPMHQLKDSDFVQVPLSFHFRKKYRGSQQWTTPEIDNTLCVYAVIDMITIYCMYASYCYSLMSYAAHFI